MDKINCGVIGPNAEDISHLEIFCNHYPDGSFQIFLEFFNLK